MESRDITITPEIREALLKLYRDIPNQEDICKTLGVSRATWCAWVNKTQRVKMRVKNWRKLVPYIQRYLPARMVVGDNSTVINGDVLNSRIGNLVGAGLPVEQFKRQLQDAIMDSDLEPSAKSRVYKIVNEVGG